MKTMRDLLTRQIMDHEGLRLKPYQDTVGKWTIGFGHNLTDKGISLGIAATLLREDLDEAMDAVDDIMPWVKTLDPVRQRVIYDMAFNIGCRSLTGFVHMLDAVKNGRYDEAADHMLASKWASQVHGRAVTLATMMRSGVDPWAPTTQQA